MKKVKISKLPNGGELYEYNNGGKHYFLNVYRHREDGPAIEHSNGDKWWYINGKLHREDGPALEDINGNNFWYLNDVRIPCKTQKQFEQLMKLKAFW
jgi:hypothetical protein